MFVDIARSSLPECAHCLGSSVAQNVKDKIENGILPISLSIRTGRIVQSLSFWGWLNSWL